jgi:hypothetical protein
MDFDFTQSTGITQQRNRQRREIALYNLPFDIRLYILSYLKLYLTPLHLQYLNDNDNTLKYRNKYIKYIFGYDWNDSTRNIQQVFVNFDLRSMDSLFGQYQFGSETKHVVHGNMMDWKFMDSVYQNHTTLEEMDFRWKDDEQQSKLENEADIIQDDNSNLSLYDPVYSNQRLYLRKLRLEGQPPRRQMKSIRKFIQEFVLLCSNLTVLSLIEQKVGDETTVLLTQCLPKLISVDLSDNRITTIGAQALFTHPSIKYLNISRNKITNQSLETLAQNQSITYLNLFRSTFTNCTDFVRLLEPHSRIKYLKLGGPACDCKSSQVASLIRNNTKLVILDLNNFGPKIDDSGEIGKCIQPQLLSLHLRNSLITDKTLQQFSNNNITTLEIAMINTISDVGLEHISIQMKQLKQLIVFGCENITHVGVTLLFNDLNELELIDLSNCEKIDFCDFELIEAMKNNNCIKKLKLNHNTSVTDECIQPLIEHNHCIEYLQLNAVDITSDAFKDLPENKSIHTLCICYFGNSRGTLMFLRGEQLQKAKESIDALVNTVLKSFHLRKLDLRYASSLTLEHKKQLSQCKNLQQIYYSTKV